MANIRLDKTAKRHQAGSSGTECTPTGIVSGPNYYNIIRQKLKTEAIYKAFCSFRSLTSCCSLTLN